MRYIKNYIIIFVFILFIGMLSTKASTVYADSDQMNVTIGNVKGLAGQYITIPVDFMDVPSYGINNCDFKIEYNSEALEIDKVEPGSIVTYSSLNFKASYVQPGIISFVFCDPTQGSRPIRKNGCFAAITFKVKNDVDCGSYPIKINSVGEFSGSNSGSLTKCVPNFTDGNMIIGEKTPRQMNVTVGNVKGLAGQYITVPVDFMDIPSYGINNCDFKIAYNTDALEIAKVESGSIFTNTDGDFYSNYSKPGIVCFMFGDSTEGSKPIRGNGCFAAITFKVKNDIDFGSYPIKISSVGAFLGSKGGILTKHVPNFTDGNVIVCDKIPSKMNVTIGNVKGLAGQYITIPVDFMDIPSYGINGCDFKIEYNSDALEVAKVEPGSIVTNPVAEFSASYVQPGIVCFMFFDNTGGSTHIRNNGCFATITFKVKNNVGSGSYPIKINSVGAFSGSVDKMSIKYTPNFTDGNMIIGEQPTSQMNVTIGNVKGADGQYVTVPVDFMDIPSYGINNCDFKIEYNSDALEIAKVEPGSIVKNSVAGFRSSYSKLGIVCFMFCDPTKGSKPIRSNGCFATITFKVKNDIGNGSYPVKFNRVGAVSGSNGGLLIKYAPNFNEGSINLQ